MKQDERTKYKHEHQIQDVKGFDAEWEAYGEPLKRKDAVEICLIMAVALSINLFAFAKLVQWVGKLMGGE